MRLATVTTIGLVTVASIIGGAEFGSYGQLITEGLQTLFPTQYLIGALLSLLLAMVADGTLRPGLLVGEVIELGQVGRALAAMDEPGSGAGITVVSPVG